MVSNKVKAVTKNRSYKPKTKYILDTSIQYEKVKVPGFPASEFKGNLPEFQTLHFVLYEYKVGFIRCLIDFYSLVELTDDPSRAMMKATNTFKNRQPNNLLILQALIYKLSQKVSSGSTTKDYLRMVEAAILFAMDTFEVGIKHHQGSFASNPLVKHRIESQQDFDSFVDLCNQSKILPMEDFWTKNSATLALLTSDLTKYESKNNSCKNDYTSMSKRLIEIQKDVKNSSKQPINHGVGDPIIFTDSSRNFSLLTTDCLFTVFNDLDKSMSVLKLQQP